MNYSPLEEAYGSPFGQKVPITHQRKDVKEGFVAKPEFSSMDARSKEALEKNKDLIASVTGSLPLDTTAATESFRGTAPVGIRDHVSVREKFTATASQPAGVFDGTEQAEKLSRILRLIEQNKTGYERPATQDMVLYIATGVFFLFTFDTFVMMGKSMRGR
jgi:hypothetical protein